MAACELKGELKYRDGQTNQFAVQVDGDLKSMITGVKKLNADISVVLTALVEQEKGSTGDSTGVLDGKMLRCLWETNKRKLKIKQPTLIN